MRKVAGPVGVAVAMLLTVVVVVLGVGLPRMPLNSGKTLSIPVDPNPDWHEDAIDLDQVRELRVVAMAPGATAVLAGNPPGPDGDENVPEGTFAYIQRPSPVPAGAGPADVHVMAVIGGGSPVQLTTTPAPYALATMGVGANGDTLLCVAKATLQHIQGTGYRATDYATACALHRPAGNFGWTIFETVVDHATLGILPVGFTGPVDGTISNPHYKLVTFRDRYMSFMLMTSRSENRQAGIEGRRKEEFTVNLATRRLMFTGAYQHLDNGVVDVVRQFNNFKDTTFPAFSPEEQAELIAGGYATPETFSDGDCPPPKGCPNIVALPPVLCPVGGCP